MLVVDDSKVITDLVKLMLERSGYGCVSANSARQCMGLLQEERFDLILLDVAMPETTGLDVLDTLRKDERQKDVRVVLFTASAPTEGEVQGYVARGAAGLIRKPVKKEFLLAQIEKYLTS
ncbi:MAG: response regulator [Nitrososphaerales archaeon]